jgi:glycopeptide antibiotics resistance protein
MALIMYFNILTVLTFILIWIIIVTFLRFKKKKNLVYLLFFTIFYIYIVKVLDYTLFQFQSLILLKYFIPNLILRGQPTQDSINIIPLINLTSQDLKTSLLNILLFVPFGFGLPFITKFSLRKVILLGLLFSLGIEIMQILTGYLAKVTFRIADINDLIFNTIGAAIGVLFFAKFTRIFRNISLLAHRH